MGTIKDLQNKLHSFSKELASLQGKTITIIPDAKGMIDRQCPKETCRELFKVNLEDWRNIVRDEACFCPACRNSSVAKDYLPSAQRTAMIETVHQALSQNWKYGRSVLGNIRALDSVAEFEVDIQCEKCNVRFSVIGAAYFCPCCGYSSIARTASEAIKKTILTASKIEEIRSSLEQTQSKTETAALVKTIIEQAVSACIGTLQSFSETKYNVLSVTPAPFNAFQNTEKANKLWLALTQQGYDQWLTPAELSVLVLFTQRRHLLEHKGGIVDAKYLSATNDAGYDIGQRLVINGGDIVSLGNIIQKIINSINQLS